MNNLSAKALLVMIISISLWLPTSLQASNHSHKDTKDQMRLEQIEADKHARLQRFNKQRSEKKNEQTHFFNAISTSGLDKDKQVEELTNTLVYIYNTEEFFTDFWNNPKSPATRILDPDKDVCMKNEFNYDDVRDSFNATAKNHINSQTAEKNHKDLELLIDSELSYELHNISHASLIGDEDYHYVFRLHGLQKPKLAFAVREIVNNPDYSKLAKLIAVNIKPQNTDFMQVLQAAAKKCNFKLNSIE